MATGFLALTTISLLIVVIVLSSKQNKPRELADLPQASADVRQLISTGHKLEAIKLYRRQSGASLVESRNVVDHLGAATQGNLS